MNRGKRIRVALLVTLCACRSVSRPSNDRPFASGTDCAEIRGCFAERGEAAAGEPEPRLSARLWPAAALDDSITLVSFEPTEDGGVVARAQSGGRVVRERRLELPEDRAGPLRLADGVWFPPFTQEGEEPAPLVGAYGGATELGLDSAGDLALRQTGWTVGLVYLVFPTVFSLDSAVRFSRVACPGGEGEGIP